MDLVIDHAGYSRSVEAYTYPEHVEMLRSSDIPYPDYLQSQVKPETVVFVEYSKDGVGTFVEILEYATPEDAAREMSTQTPFNSVGKIFKRFETQEWGFQEDRFLVFLFCYPGEGDANHERARSLVRGLLQAYAEKLVDELAAQTSEPPNVNFRGEVIWGIEAGDVITWSSGGATMYSSDEEEEIQWEIVEVSEDSRAVLMRRPQNVLEVVQQPAWANDRNLIYRETISVPHYEYAWATADEDGLKFDTGGQMIYPLVRGADTLKDLLEKQISRLPEKTVTDGGQQITVYGRTSSGMGFTPLKTEWLDITVHAGTGIVTSYEWYYHDREYDVQSSSSIDLKNTNFALASRRPYSPTTAEEDTSQQASEGGDELADGTRDVGIDDSDATDLQDDGGLPDYLWIIVVVLLSIMGVGVAVARVARRSREEVP
jgi:hypothetical protein